MMEQTALDEVLKQKFDATRLTAEEAPGLHEMMQRLTSKAGMGPVNIYLSDGLPGFGNLGKINAASIGKDRVLLTRGILELLGSADLTKAPSAELEGVLAHELSHCKGYLMQTSARTLPLLLMPAACVLGYRFYRGASRASEPVGQHQSLEEQADAAHKAVQQETGKPVESWQSSLITGAKYLAAAALGLGAGVMMMRGASLHYEWQADALAKQLMGTGKPLANALHKLEEGTISLILREGVSELVNAGKLSVEAGEAKLAEIGRLSAKELKHALRTGKISGLDEIAANGMGVELSTWQKVVMSIIHAHPSTEERIAHLMR